MRTRESENHQYGGKEDSEHEEEGWDWTATLMITAERKGHYRLRLGEMKTPAAKTLEKARES